MKILEEEPPLVDECKLPWVIDAFLYPISASGMINLAVFVLLPILVSFLLGLLARFLSPFLRSGTSYIIMFLKAPYYVIYCSYVCYYISHCVIDSSKGSRRASDLPIANTFDAGDLVAQVVLLLGCVAICFGPAALYYIFTRRIDYWFWVLLALGGVFFPMCFLRGVMFDCFDALNPVEIFRSIFSTFLPYCCLVLFCMAVGGFAVMVLPRLPLWRFLKTFIIFYIAFVLVHRLGWFYWWYKDKLGWGL
ncbi:MAG: hypothetical protein ACYS3S_21630 [Planctomycetota bacterium]|jgi:hypothetical protein